MTWDDYKRTLIAKNPQLADSERLHITPESFLRSMRQAWDMGFEAGKRSGGEATFDFERLFGRFKG